MCLCTDRFDLVSLHSLVSDTAAFTWRTKLEQHLFILHLLEPMLWGKNFHWHNFRNEKDKRTMTPMLPPVWIKVFLHFRVGLSLYVILKRTLWELEAHRLLPPVEDEQTSRLAPISLKREPLSPQMVGWNSPIYPNSPNWMGGPWVVGCIRSQVLGRSPVQVLFRP